MKFLVIGALARHGLPLKRVLPILKASKKWHEQKIEDGTIDCLYNVIEGGGFSIQNHESAEDAYNSLFDYPGYILYDWEIKPLVDNKQIMDKSISRIEMALEFRKQADS
jgi:hypothetical protein